MAPQSWCLPKLALTDLPLNTLNNRLNSRESRFARTALSPVRSRIISMLNLLTVLLLSGSLAVESNQTVLPRVDDLFAGFRANYSAFPTLRVLWSRKQENTNAYFKRAEMWAQMHKRDSDDESKSPRDRAISLQAYQNVTKLLSNPLTRVPSELLEEFRTDRTNYQLRIFKASKESDLPSGCSFSKRLPATPENLRTIFASTQISSYDQGKSESVNIFDNVR